MKLSRVKPGVYKVKKVSSKRLMELGFVKGRAIEVILNKGYLVVEIHNARFVISKDIAEGVEVD